MLRVNLFGKRSICSLNIVIGAKTLECGVMHDRGGDRQWLAESLLDFALTDTEDLSSLLHLLCATLQRLQHMSILPAIDNVRVVVADNWLALVGVPWSPSLKSAEDAEAYARNHLQEGGFSPQPDDLLRLDDAPFGAPRLVVSYPSSLVSACQDVADHLQARLVSLLPLSLAAWFVARRSRQKRNKVLAVLDDALLIVARSNNTTDSNPSEVTVRLRPAKPGMADQELLDIWQRLSLREPQLAALKMVPLLDLRRSAGAQHPAAKPFEALDFPGDGGIKEASPCLYLAAGLSTFPVVLDAISPGGASSWQRWFAFGATALLAAGACFELLQSNAAFNSALTQLNVATSAALPPPSPTAWSRDEIAQVQAVNIAVRELNMPIAPLLRALEPPQDISVAVLNVEMGGAALAQASSVKIVAEAKSSADMPRYVAFVAERKPFTGAYLTRHEIDENNPESRYRFTVEALWSE